MMSPVDEVALFLHKEKVRNDAALRQNDMLHSITLRYTTPKRSQATKSSVQKKKEKPSDYRYLRLAARRSHSISHICCCFCCRRLLGVKPPPTTEQLQVPKTIRVEWARVERLWMDPWVRSEICVQNVTPLQNWKFFFQNR